MRAHFDRIAQYLTDLTSSHLISRCYGAGAGDPVVDIFHIPNTLDLYAEPQMNSLVICARPAMHARDSSGRQVSLLNDEPTRTRDVPYSAPPPQHDQGRECNASNSFVPASSSSPTTPSFWRSDSYESRTSIDPYSPLSPTLSEYVNRGSIADSYSTDSYSNASAYEEHLDDRPPLSASYSQELQSQSQLQSRSKSQPQLQPRPQLQSSAQPDTTVPSSYDEQTPGAYEDEPHDEPHDEPQDDDSSPKQSGASTGKRYPCRFKDIHGCDKSFTTSGHASRHSKIHTAEKAVSCTFPDCPKKFTRADNMKQHLEIHFKDRSRSGAGHRNSISSTSRLTIAAGIKKPSRVGRADQLTIDTRVSFAEYPPDHFTGMAGPTPPASPGSSYDALDMVNFQQSLPTPGLRPSRCRGTRNLDALAAAVARRIDQRR